MPRPILKKIDITDIIKKSLDFTRMTSTTPINFISQKKRYLVLGDEDQLNRVFLNLIKNSEESFVDISRKNPNFKGNINIEINNNNDYIICRLTTMDQVLQTLKKQ